MNINLENFKNTIEESLDGLHEYQWKETINFYRKDGEFNEYLSDLLTEKEQEKFWELSQDARNVLVDKLGKIYNEVWMVCHDEHVKEEAEEIAYSKRYGNGY